jgi:hypothetical protein
MVRSRWWVLFALTVLGLCLTAMPAQAARFITLSVELDGKPLLGGHKTDDGIPGLKTVFVWRYLKSAPLYPEAEASIRPEPDRPLEALLRGNLVVKLEHARQTARTVQASELKLTRQSAESNQWYLDPAWVESNDPPGDPVEEAREIAQARFIDALRMPSTLATVLAIGLGWILGLAALVLTLMRRYLLLAKWLAVAALAVCLGSFAFSSLSHWHGSELFGGGSLLLPHVSGTGLLLALLAFILSRRLAKAG